ncbi:MAG: RNA polymerase sigma factor [Candidatus Hydrogenedentes bacterium]|nr:RNA polymerase sigma factor [Candidatus Hydrogenedentota bacterium]
MSSIALSWTHAIFTGGAGLLREPNPVKLSAMHSAESCSPGSVSIDADRADVAACKGGDESALRRIIERNQNHVASIMWRFTRDRNLHAELVHDVFVQAYLSLHTYRAEAPFAHWLSRVALRVGYRYWRKARRDTDLERRVSEEWRRTPDSNDTSPGEAAELIHRTLALLPPRDRLVLTLRYLEDKTVEETADLLGWTRSMVKVQVWRARAKLQRIMSELEAES